MEHHELLELAHATPAPHPEEDVPARFGAQLTTCTAPGCTVPDNHPKVVMITDLGAVDDDGNVQRPTKYEDWHHDCHALATRDPHSIEIVAQAGGLKGHELRLALHGDPANGVEPTIDPTRSATAMSPASVGPAAEADDETDYPNDSTGA